jgi:hypothetical protein
MKQAIYSALKRIREHIVPLTEGLAVETDGVVRALTSAIDAKLLTRFSPGFPLVAAICGGGSSGKSTLFNSLLNDHLAPSGGKAGMNRRVLFSVPASAAKSDDVIAHVARAFNLEPAPLQQPTDLLQPGAPLFVEDGDRHAPLVLLDTPDFDTGSGGHYTNREVARSALEAADILIYVFTNSNYNNRDNTDFISQVLTGIGRRHCFLVYRVYPSYTAREVEAHAMTVARNLYGDDATDHVLGIYRVDEDNQVAAGQRFMTLRPAREADPDFFDALQSLDALKLRSDQHAAILADTVEQTRAVLGQSGRSLDRLKLYLEAVQTVQSHCVQKALQHFPLDHVMRRFARIWAASDPGAVKFMRRAGTIVEFPLKAILGAAGWARKQLSTGPPPSSSTEDFSQTFDEDLVTAVTELHQQVLGPQLSVPVPKGDPVAERMRQTLARSHGGKKSENASLPSTDAPTGESPQVFNVPVHPVLKQAQQQLAERDFSILLKSILGRKEDLLAITDSMEADLMSLADDFRKKMGVWDKVGQTFWAFLNVLPATLAVTYVLSTGDPVGAVGIKVKLAGLFGMKDLYALFAIPVTRGMKKADRKQLEAMLGPIVQTWLNHKMRVVDDLLTETITGNLRQTAERHSRDAADGLAQIERALAVMNDTGTKKYS